MKKWAEKIRKKLSFWTRKVSTALWSPIHRINHHPVDKAQFRRRTQRGGKRPWLRLITWPSTIWVAYLFPFYLQIYSANSLVSAWLYTRLPTTRRGLFHTFTVMLPFSPNLDPANSKKFLFPFWSITQTMFVNTWQFKARRTAVQNIETISRKSNRMISVAVPRPFSL